MSRFADLARRDLATVWHPCTQTNDHEWLPMIPVVQLAAHLGRRAAEPARDGIRAATCD